MGEQPQLIRVGTWNVRRLGHGTRRFEDVAQVIETSFDAVALQEVMTPQGVSDLLAHRPGWDAEMSPRAVGRGPYKEWYAVLYRVGSLDVQHSFAVDDPRDVFAREPFVVCMRATAFDFCLVTIHIIYGDRVGPRDAELRALGDVVNRLRERDGERDWLVVGDFNRTPTARGWDALKASGWRFTLSGRVATSLGKQRYSNPYDHILIDDRFTTELVGSADRIDIVEMVCAGDFGRCRRLVSDHAPVSARFVVDGVDDD